MKTIEIMKNYKGAVPVRDYIVAKCLKNKETLRIIHKGLTMTLSPEDLIKKKFQLTRRKIISQYKGTYFLYDFRFVPDDDSKLKQGKLL